MGSNVGDRLAKGFVAELLAWAFERQSVFDVCREYLKFAYLTDEAEKKLWQWMTNRYDLTGLVPTVRQAQQAFREDNRVLDKLTEVRDVEISEADKTDGVLDEFELFVRRMKFLEANDRITETYNRGDKEAAWGLFVKYAEDFAKFGIRDASFERVFEGFALRQVHRLSEDWGSRIRIPTGIDELDYSLGGDTGGPETGECVLWLGMSGAGKSQCLVHLGIAAARQGYRVVHFQLEGTREQCLNRYDAAWTGTLYEDIKVGAITAKKMTVAKKIIEKLKRKDIFVVSVEEFGGKTLPSLRSDLKRIETKFGRIGVIIVDYLELLELGDGHSYAPSEERHRQQRLAKAMKQLAMEFNAVVHTATQTNDVAPEQRNDPEFVITRSNLNEDRGKVRPMDALLTMNQTDDERRGEIIRLYVDKAREHRAGKVIRICTNFSRSRFYDRVRTLSMTEEDWDEFYRKKE